jgi:hypothetical protein
MVLRIHSRRGCATHRQEVHRTLVQVPSCVVTSPSPSTTRTCCIFFSCRRQHWRGREIDSSRRAREESLRCM